MQTSTRVLNFSAISRSAYPSRGEFSLSFNSTTSNALRANASTLAADGSFNMSNSSRAAISSGFIAMDKPSSRFMKSREASLYSGVRILAIVAPAPILLARKHESIFISSEPVTAINSSASATPASSSVSQSAQFPTTPITSWIFAISVTTACSLSITITS